MDYEIPQDGNMPRQLHDHNHLAWAIWVKSYLIARGCWDPVEGSEEEAAKRRDPEYRKWEIADRRAWLDIVSMCNVPDAIRVHKPETARSFGTGWRGR